VTGLDNLKRLVHENMLPALERCSVILSRFSGIAKFQGSNETVSFTNQQISLISDTVACLHLVSSKILIQVIDEIELFSAFSSWLRYEIDRLASEGSSTPSDDAAEKEAAIDHAKVLLYIQSIMTMSPLKIYLGDSTPEDQENWNHSEQGLPMFDTLDKQLKKQEKGLPFNESLPRVDLLYKLLSRQAETIFSQIAEAEKRNVLFGQGHEIAKAENNDLIDMKITIMVQGILLTFVLS
jgi:anaphase-promoting complex subunit 4